MKDKPINIIMEEFKEELNNTINEMLEKYKINFYLLEILLKELHQNVAVLKQQELEQVRQSLEETKGKEVK